MTAQEIAEDFIQYIDPKLMSPHDIMEELRDKIIEYAKYKSKVQKKIIKKCVKGHGHEIKNAPEPKFE